MAEAIVFMRPGNDIPCTATAAVSGKRCVNISGDQQTDGTVSVATAAAAGLILGVAAFDAAIGGKVTVIAGAGTVVPIVAEAAIAAGAEVQVGAAGGVITKAAGVAIGRALTGAANAADAKIRLY